MFGFSFAKFAVLIIILVAIWYGFKILSRGQNLTNKRDSKLGKNLFPKLKEMTKWKRWGIALSIIWVAIFLQIQISAKLFNSDEVLTALILGLIAIWIAMWAFVKDKH